MVNKVVAFEEKLNIYNEKIQKKQLQNFPTMIKSIEDLIDLFQEIYYSIISIFITTLLDQLQKKVPEKKRKIKKCLLLVEHLWHQETTTISDCNYPEFCLKKKWNAEFWNCSPKI